MIIETKRIVAYQKGLQSLYMKGHPISKCLFLDFKNEEIKFMNPITSIVVSFPLDIKDNTKKVDNFFVSMLPFLTLCQSYSVLDISPDREFTTETGESFKPESQDDDNFEFPEKSFDNLTYDTIDVSDFSKMINAASFLGENGSKGVIIGNTITSTDAVSLYEATSLAADYTQSYNIYKNNLLFITKILSKEANNTEIMISKKEEYLFFILNNELKMICPEADGKLPSSYYTGEFMESYKCDSFITVDKEIFKENLNFFGYFVADVINERMLMKVVNNHLILSSIENHKAEKNMPIVHNEAQENLEIFFSRNRILSLIEHIEDNNINIHFKEDSRILFFTGENNKNINTICVRLVND
jgi:DNA polymerase III sliding clamp (beta) subunit (PCNA family)